MAARLSPGSRPPSPLRRRCCKSTLEGWVHVGMEIGHFSLTRCFLPQLRPPGAAGCTGPPATRAAGHEAFLHTLPCAHRPLGLEAVTPSVALTDAAAAWTSPIPRAVQGGSCSGEGQSLPLTRPSESSARKQPCSSAKEDSCPLPNQRRRA